MPAFSYTSGNPTNLTAGGNASMSDVQGPLTDLRTFLNGGLGTSNLSSTAAITEAQLASAGNGLAKGAFSAYRNAAGNVANGAVIVFDAEEDDISSWYDVATGRFTPQVAGIYRLSWSETTTTSPAADAWLQAVLRKNGVAHKNGQVHNWRTASAGWQSTGTARVQANGSTDYFDITSVNNHGTVALAVGATTTYFQGEMVGRL